MAQPNVSSDAENWIRSDRYHNSHTHDEDPILDSVLAFSKKEGLPEIAVSVAQGKFLQLLAKSIKAKRILEVGTLGGYSTIWLARAIPDDGKVVTFEIDPHHAEVAAKNIASASLTNKVQIVVGPAVDNLPSLKEDGSFDLAFIDADKESNTEYFIHAKRLVRSGGVIIVDNVVRGGKVADPDNKDARIEGVRRLLRHIKQDKEVEGATIATVGEKGYDGFLYSLKK